MSLERKFHKLIEKQNQQEKEQKWQELQTALEFVPTEETNSSGNTKVLFKSKARALICGIALFLLILAIITTVLVCQNLNKKKLSIRYCTSDEYSVSEIDTTLKEYASSIKKNLLYFDWYDEDSIILEEVLKLDETDEIICFHEMLVDVNTGYEVSLRVVDRAIDIDMLALFETMCEQTLQEHGIDVKWGGSGFRSCAIFEYEGYKYYIEIANATAQDIALDYVSILLGN